MTRQWQTLALSRGTKNRGSRPPACRSIPRHALALACAAARGIIHFLYWDGLSRLYFL